MNVHDKASHFENAPSRVPVRGQNRPRAFNQLMARMRKVFDESIGKSYDAVQTQVFSIFRKRDKGMVIQAVHALLSSKPGDYRVEGGILLKA